ncbi:MAG: nucleotidyltransferase [Treponema sp. GWB1_62_6]|nr:MAG: nucleotidyltransferase [Treponema sp. GWB1_62_6]OHE68242.1 MAG: nucleotidyltransferase [Treponema sp. RIFOXYC1_FULL_61_9]OHE69517.1 MAG: nucleotidyltransferase [Treponema sp. GWC1_61_84]HCM25880.1 nucleotidyltransferase [Treponema sp.]
MEEDIRWQQRFQNYSKALAQLDEFVELPSLNKFERQGLIQCFEYTFELAWKTMKDYLEFQGLQAPTPRAAIQNAFSAGLIADGHIWIDALEKRNLMAHTYDEGNAAEAERLIRNSYHPVLRTLRVFFSAMHQEEG